MRTRLLTLGAVVGVLLVAAGLWSLWSWEVAAIPLGVALTAACLLIDDGRTK